MQALGTVLAGHRLRVTFDLLDKLYYIFFFTTFVSLIYIVPFFWGLLDPYQTHPGWDLHFFIEHGLNLAVLLVDLFISRIPFNSYFYQVRRLLGGTLHDAVCGMGCGPRGR